MKRVLLKSCRIDLETGIDASDFAFTTPDETITEIYADGNLNLKYLPLNIYEIYPNMIGISFWYCSVVAVSKANFQKLSKIRRLALNQNRISVIENDTFEDLESLEWLLLDNNRITKIDGQGKRHQLQFRRKI
jgi:Leucine-rich repeat (LRR) protein